MYLLASDTRYYGRGEERSSCQSLTNLVLGIGLTKFKVCAMEGIFLPTELLIPRWSDWFKILL